jgi:hypothetical protein
MLCEHIDMKKKYLKKKIKKKKKKKETPWPESASELYRPSDRRLSAKLVLTFVDRGCHVVSVTDLYGRILGSVPDPLLLRKSGSVGKRTRTSGSVGGKV